jgi:cation/acetate symporter
VISRTSDVPEYYVAGRRVPAIFNGMATAADWISAATFISLAGGLYLHGFDGLAYIMGWTGGYCLVALLIAPYLRKFGQYTIPDFLAARYRANPAATAPTWSASWPWRPPSCSFTYVVAQIYGVGLITSRFTGIDFSIGIFLGLASILVCSFLGGMRAITWTQVAQYIIILVAYLIPVIWLSAKHADLPVPPVAYGKVLPKLSARSTSWKTTPRKEVRQIFQARADDYDRRLKACRNPGSMAVSRRRTRPTRSGVMRAPRWPTSRPPARAVGLSQIPDEAERKWTEARAANLARAAAGLADRALPGRDQQSSDIKRNNFLALVFCLMLGTAACRTS